MKTVKIGTLVVAMTLMMSPSGNAAGYPNGGQPNNAPKKCMDLPSVLKHAFVNPAAKPKVELAGLEMAEGQLAHFEEAPVTMGAFLIANDRKYWEKTKPNREKGAYFDDLEMPFPNQEYQLENIHWVEQDKKINLFSGVTFAVLNCSKNRVQVLSYYEDKDKHGRDQLDHYAGKKVITFELVSPTKLRVTYDTIVSDEDHCIKRVPTEKLRATYDTPEFFFGVVKEVKLAAPFLDYQVPLASETIPIHVTEEQQKNLATFKEKAIIRPYPLTQESACVGQMKSSGGSSRGYAPDSPIVGTSASGTEI